MQKITLILASLVVSGFSMATQADQMRLNDINTDNCGRAQHEVRLLQTRSVRVDADCSAYVYRGYRSAAGRYYNYRLYTTIAAPDLRPGVRVKLNDIDTDNCVWARSEVSLLNTRSARISAVCSPYVYRGYRSDNGRYYNYRLYTTLSVR